MSATPDDGDLERIRDAARLLHDAARPLRVLSTLAWPAEVREEFLRRGGDRLPDVPAYRPVDPAPTLDLVNAARRQLRPGSLVDDWLDGEARAVESTALMLASAGTPALNAYSRQLYGVPTQPLRYDPTTPLALAERVRESTSALSANRLLRPAVRDRTADDVAAFIVDGVGAHFGDDAPDVLVVDELSANALATPTKIKIRRGASFTGRDAIQLLNHEAFIHVATAKNGRAQPDLPILAIGHPGTTRTQEGLAVFSEFVSGSLDLDRLGRLADRVQAVQLVADGADFVELYRWFLDRSPSPEQAFESTRRIFRGAPLGGGAPFTKDCGYLSGLLSVMTFVRAAFRAGRADTLGLLFAGKLDLWSVPALAEARGLGLCRPGRFLPPWAREPDWVLTWLTLSTFLAEIDLEEVAGAVGDLLARCPVVEIEMPSEPAPPAAV